MQLPLQFLSQMENLLGSSVCEDFVQALDAPAQVGFRPNKAKGVDVASGLESIPWSSSGYYLKQRPNFTFDPLIHAGAYYVQEPSSMFIEQAFNACDVVPHAVLDLCAAPGGKSTLLRTLLPDGCLLVANEPVKLRAQVLLENLLKWGHPDVAVTNNYPADFGHLSAFFDIVLVDAPCSGEGMFRKDNPALEEWSEANISHCAARQRKIVEGIWPALKPGGFLIYSTCTYNLEEDERNVDYFCKQLGAEAVEIPINPSWNITGNLLPDSPYPVYRFLPHKTKGEGFFLALLQKKEDGFSLSVRKKTKGAGAKGFVALPKDFRAVLNASDFMSTEEGELLYAVRETLISDMVLLQDMLHPLSIGLPIALRKGNKLVPHQALALSNLLQRKAFPTCEVAYEDAINYLRRLSLVLPAETARGIVLLLYKGVPLGFVNNLGNHANNLYPQNWKIRSGFNHSDNFDFLQILNS